MLVDRFWWVDLWWLFLYGGDLVGVIGLVGAFGFVVLCILLVLFYVPVLLIVLVVYCALVVSLGDLWFLDSRLPIVIGLRVLHF